MYPPLQEPILDDVIRNVGSHSYTQNIPGYTGDGSLSYLSEASFENLPYEVNPIPQDEKATIMPPFGYHAMPINIPSTASVDPPHTPPTMALTQNLPGIPSLSSYSPSLSSSSYTSSSSSLASSWNPAPWTDWSKAHSGVLSAMGQGSYYANFLDQASGNYHGSGSPPDGLGTFSSSPATSPGLDARDITSEAMDVSPGQYSAIHSGSLVQRQRQKYERNDDQIGVQGTYDRRFTCTFDNCGKSFSGEWEKTRHIKSLHYPPSIGCRDCNYKQSRKDLFSEHCKKRHPGESIEELMVHLVHTNAICP